MAQDDGVKVSKARTAKGKRALEKRAPKEVRLACTMPHAANFGALTTLPRNGLARRPCCASCILACMCKQAQSAGKSTTRLRSAYQAPPSRSSALYAASTAAQPIRCRIQVEDAKRVLLLQGNKVSQTVKDVLSDLAMVKRGEAFKMTRKNPVWPFEAGHETSLQFFCERADCGLFCLGNHNNKRPHNLVLGRVFNAQLLDMIELGVERHVPISACKAGKHVLVGSKVCAPRTLACCHAHVRLVSCTEGRLSCPRSRWSLKRLKWRL